jgi:hypothetical protein
MGIEKVRNGMEKVAIGRQEHRIQNAGFLKNRQILDSFLGSTPEIENHVAALLKQSDGGPGEVFVEEEPHAAVSYSEIW